MSLVSLDLAMFPKGLAQLFLQKISSTLSLGSIGLGGLRFKPKLILAIDQDTTETLLQLLKARCRVYTMLCDALKRTPESKLEE